MGVSISNPAEAINKALHLSSELATVWASSEIKDKERLQKLVFPEGIVFDKKNGAFRTTKINSVFQLIAGLTRDSEEKQKGQTDEFHRLSLSAEREGFEPPDL